MKPDGFFDVPRVGMRTTEGPVEVPMFFYDVAVRRLDYFVDYAAASAKLEGTGLEPCRFSTGKAMALLIFFQYRDVSIGAYDEVTIVIPCFPGSFKDPKFYIPNLFKRNGQAWTIGGYVLEMPVTIPEARAAGREIWGYPKFETRIPFRLTRKDFEFGVLDPECGDTIFDVRGSLGPGLTVKASDMVTFGNHEDTIIKTITEVDGRFKDCICRDIHMEMGSVDHRMSRNLKDLGMDRLKPFIVETSDSVRTRLCKGWPVAYWKTPPMPYPVEGEGPATLIGP